MDWLMDKSVWTVSTHGASDGMVVVLILSIYLNGRVEACWNFQFVLQFIYMADFELRMQSMIYVANYTEIILKNSTADLLSRFLNTLFS